jgi:hypothetical protein
MFTENVSKVIGGTGQLLKHFFGCELLLASCPNRGLAKLET